MEYRLPTINDYEILKDYVTEHYANYEKSITASVFLTESNYYDWVEKINRNSEVADDEWGKYYLYLVFDNNKLVGLLDIRFDLTDDLRNKYGDIGYGVRPSERNKGYGNKILAYGLTICKEKNMKYVIVGCYDKNIGSKKIIVKNGGVLLRQDIETKRLSDYWEIELKQNYYKIKL